MSTRILVLPWIFLLLVPALAQAEEKFHNHGVYLGGAFAVGLELFDESEGLGDYDKGFGADVWIGYRLNRYLGIEAQFVYLDGYDQRFRGSDVESNSQNLVANVKLYPFAGRVQPYLAAGFGGGRFEANVSDEDTDRTVDRYGALFRFGAGVDWYVLDSLALVRGVGVTVPTGDIKITDSLEVKFGLQYRF